MVALLVEGLESAFLPCSLVLLAPGLAALLAAREDMILTGVGFAVGAVVLAWLRLSGTGGDWPLGVAAVALISAAIALATLPAGAENRLRRDRAIAAGAGMLAGGASAELWEPCVGASFGTLLNELPDRGVGGGALLAVYLVGVLAPLVGFVAIVKLLPPPLVTPFRTLLAAAGGLALGAMAIATAAGFHDDVTGQLIAWSL